MENLTQERKRQDDKLFNFDVNASNMPIKVAYQLLTQKWLVEDQRRRGTGVGGIGPQGFIRNRLAYAAWTGNRTIKYPESWDNEKQRRIQGKQVTEDGILVYGNNSSAITVNDFLAFKQTDEVQKCDEIPMPSIEPTCFDFAPYLSKPPRGVDLDSLQSEQYLKKMPQIELLMGGSKGTLICYDPSLMMKGKVQRFNQSKISTSKTRKVEHVKWFESLNENENSIKFIVVFDDGTIYIYFKEQRESNDKSEYPNPKQIIKVPLKEVDANGKPLVKEYTREQIILWMQQEVENYDFEKIYSRSQSVWEAHARSILSETKEIHNCIQVTVDVMTNRALNFIVTHYRHQVADINPYLIMRFDVRTINDICTFRVGENRREHWIIAVCNDGYVRVFSVLRLAMIKAIKGPSGNPVCIDVAKTKGNGYAAMMLEPRDIIAVGYEDDTFIVYSIVNNFQPLYRGIGHRSFVSQVKFDNYYMEFYLDQLHKQNLDMSSKKNNFVDGVDLDSHLLGDQKSRDKSDTLAQLLRRKSTISMSQKSVKEREYRLLTGGEDGMVMWWNFKAPYTDPATAAIPNDSGSQNIVEVNINSISEIQPSHQIHLSVGAQIYSLIIGPNILAICQNDCILSYYKTSYHDDTNEEKEIESTKATEQESQVQIGSPVSHKEDEEVKEESSPQKHQNTTRTSATRKTESSEQSDGSHQHKPRWQSKQPAVNQTSELNDDVDLEDELAEEEPSGNPPRFDARRNKID